MCLSGDDFAYMECLPSDTSVPAEMCSDGHASLAYMPRVIGNAVMARRLEKAVRTVARRDSAFVGGFVGEATHRRSDHYAYCVVHVCPQARQDLHAAADAL